jgi:rhodanese-related sulfurtransferase
MKKIASLIIITLIVAGGVWGVSRVNKEDKVLKGNGVVKVLAQDVDELLEDDNTFVVDVHTPEQIHLSETDVFIPFDQIGDNLDKLPEDKDRPILVYCRSGSMSDTASKELISRGYTNVTDLVGGINAYRETHVGVEILPEEVDLGVVDYVSGANTEFILTNNTPNELKIEGVSGSCACTQPSVEKNVLVPYESTTVKIKFEPSIHNSDEDLGDLVRLVFVDTDNENFEHLSFKLTAKVVKE